MQLSYSPTTDPATPSSKLNGNRLIVELSAIDGIFYWAGIDIPKGFDADRFAPTVADFKPDVAVSMNWKAKLHDGIKASRKLYHSIRDELEARGLFTIERQRKGQGKNQPVTPLRGVNFKGLLHRTRELAIELNARAAEAGVQVAEMLPAHGFEWIKKLFRKLCGYDLFAPGESFGETEEEVEALNDAQDDRWQAHEDRYILRLEQVLENACEWYFWKFKEPIPDDSFLASSDEDPRSRQIHWDTHRWYTFRRDLQSGLCSSWHDFQLNGIERLVIG